MRPGILTGNEPVRSPARGWTQLNGAAVMSLVKNLGLMSGACVLHTFVSVFPMSREPPLTVGERLLEPLPLTSCGLLEPLPRHTLPTGGTGDERSVIEGGGLHSPLC